MTNHRFRAAYEVLRSIACGIFCCCGCCTSSELADTEEIISNEMTGQTPLRTLGDVSGPFFVSSVEAGTEVLEDGSRSPSINNITKKYQSLTGTESAPVTPFDQYSHRTLSRQEENENINVCSNPKSDSRSQLHRRSSSNSYGSTLMQESFASCQSLSVSPEVDNFEDAKEGSSPTL